MTDHPTDLLVDLASDRHGGKVLAANDEFFAPKENLIADADPIWNPAKFTARGKWMDGWETRRRREPGHDWAIIRLGIPGIVRTVLIDTAHFTGNFPESASVEGIYLPGVTDMVELVRDPSRWTVLVPRRALRGDLRNEIDLDRTTPVTHTRLVIHPDGGVARLRLLGDPVPPDGLLDGTVDVDLAAIHNGARAIDCSDRHYSSPNRMLVPGRAEGMWDGWETKRRRGPGNDWAVIRLAGRGTVDRIELDTAHFKGNAPGSWDVEGIDAPGATIGNLRLAKWRALLENIPVTPDHRHRYEGLAGGPFTHLRLNIHPDGGVARFRAWGRSSEPWISPA
ncbi:MAG: allantoicase [Actinobacteria bacterium RBG_16_68_21]|nr:MAG: allantoicase [Actinobacteria bacterium RBG_16_68_21]